MEVYFLGADRGIFGKPMDTHGFALIAAGVIKDEKSLPMILLEIRKF